MKNYLLAAWALLPLGLWAYHEGPGQDRLALDDARAALADAQALAAAETWGKALDAYDEALGLLPEGQVALGRAIRLQRAKAQMQASQLPQAHADLRALVDELAADPAADPALLAEARAAHASAQVYMTWLMRLEGLGREQWEPEIEAARQTYRLLAEQALQRGDDAAAARHREDLEAAIRVARLELKDLQGLPLPSQ